jgi:hypothetical protein
MPNKSEIPSNFCLKLRKHIRTRRVESVSQLGVDRVVQLSFGVGPKAHHLILEFYSQGNVVLVDAGYQILTLLRSHRDDAKGLATMARHAYPVHSVRLRAPLDPAELDAALAAPAPEGGELAKGKKGKGSCEPRGPPTLKEVMASVFPHGPSAAEHCALTAGLDPSRRPALLPLSPEERSALLAAVRAWERWVDACVAGTPPGGAILLGKGKGDAKGKEAEPSAGTVAVAGGAASAGTKAASSCIDPSLAAPAVYEEYEPLLPEGDPVAQRAGRLMLRFPTFDEAVREFYSTVEGQRASAQQAQREKAAEGKLDALRRDHQRRVHSLDDAAADSGRKAELIEAHVDAVDAAMGAVNEAVASGMDWGQLERMVKEEAAAG